LGATLNPIWPLPCPDAGESAEIQLAWVDAFHSHSWPVVTVIVPAPPPAETLAADRLTWHFTGEGPVETLEAELQPMTLDVATAATTTRTNS
jgi:hypothetical protein